ncbi:Uncharacterised protein [Neisseria sicca]|nr:Uncharacterised protein [Neisseria sicca]
MVAVDPARTGIGQGFHHTDAGQAVAVDNAPVVRIMSGCNVRLPACHNSAGNLIVYTAGIQCKRIRSLQSVGVFQTTFYGQV